MVRPALLFLVLFLLAGVASAQEQHHIFRIPFQTVNGLLLLDMKLNGKTAVMVLDTGSTETLFRTGGVIAIELEPGHTTGVAARSMSNLGVSRMVSFGKNFPGVDGILGEDVLRQFSAVRIDYRNHVVELESASKRSE